MNSKIKFLTVILALNSLAFAPYQLEECTLGEARGEGVKGMTAIVQAIQNRKTLSGVYGCSADLSDVKPEDWERVNRAYNAALGGPDLVRGADHWGNAADVKVFKRSSWFKNCKQTAKIGGHYFFKCTKPTTQKRSK